jgi:hypothetical protein
MLIYIISLTLQSARNMNISNLCTNIKLTSPIYFVKDTMCHVHLPQQVDSKNVMKANFITGIGRDTFGGVLLYNLQRKVDESTSNQLLVIWGCKSECLYSHAYIIEHDTAITWNEDRLRKLHDVYDSQHFVYSYNIEHWWLDSNTKLKTVCRTLNGSFEIDRIISEEKDILYPIKPLWVDSNR